MGRILNDATGMKYSGLMVVLLFVAVGVISFGLLIPYLGLYWDDFPLAWIANTFGGEGLTRYFSTNRPYWGLLFQVTTPLFGNTPWHWQLFGLFCRIFTSLSFWYLLRQIWPRKPSTALFAGIAFLVYPGFIQQWISLIYSHFLLVMTAFILSLTLNILAARAAYLSNNKRKRDIFTGAALFLSFTNLLSMEYYFTLELIRPFLLWIVSGDYITGKSERLKKTFIAWFPYLVLFIGVIFWRVFFFSYQTTNYQFSLFDSMVSEPLLALLSLSQNILSSLWRAGILAWLQVFLPPSLSDVGRLTVILSYVVALSSILAMVFWFFFLRSRSRGDGSKHALENGEFTPSNTWEILGISATSLLLAGWPFWLIELAPALNFSLDRFTLPFMFGSALFIGGVIELLQIDLQWKFIILIILVGFSIGRHFRIANEYRRDWEVQRRFFWQMVWRIPNLTPGTIVLANELPLTYYSDNSLTAPLNWIYAPDNHTENMSYLLIYPERRLGTSLPALEEGVTIGVDYLAAGFSGSTSQAIALFYDPPACLRVLDPKIDAVNHMLPLIMQKSATLSSLDTITLGDALHPAVPPKEIYAPEEHHGWCYYYQKADLAKQRGDWDEVVRLADQAFALGDYPNDPAERIPFIEGYARNQSWQHAVQLTEESLRVSPDMIPVLCIIWRRIEIDTAASPEKDEAFNQISLMMDCSS